MKTKILFYLVVLGLSFNIKKAVAQEYYDATNSPRQYYYNNLESATAGSPSTFLPAANSTRSSNATLDIVSSSSLNGTKSLSTVGTSTLGYLRWNFYGTGSVSLASNTWEWEFDYKNVTGTDTDDPNPITAGKNSWQYWLLTSDNTYGLYLTQNGGNLILRLKYGSASNQYTNYASISMPTNTHTYQIRVVKSVIGYYNIYILDRNTSTTIQTLNINVGTNVSGVDLNTYNYSYLDATSVASNRFQFDNFNFYQQKVDYVGITSAANGITTMIYPGIVNAIPYGVNVNIRGDVIFGLITFNFSANGQALFTGGALYKTSNSVLSLTGATLLVSGVAINAAYTSQMSLPSSEYYYNAGNTNGTTANVTNYFLVAQGRNPFYSSYPTSIAFTTSTAAVDNYQSFYTSGNFPNTSNANSTGATLTVGNLYDWIGGVSTAWNTPANWLLNGTVSTTTTPTSSDVARIGVVAYQLLAKQPTVNVASTLSQLLIGTFNTPTITLTNGLTVNNGLTINASSALITTSGSLSLGSASTMGSGSSFTLNSGSQVTLQTSATFSNPGTISVNGASTFTIPNSSAFTNSGSFTLSASTLNVTSSASFTNSATGALTAGNASTINCTASIFNTGGGVITIGSSGSPATLNMGNSGYLPNSGTVLVGPTSLISFTPGTNPSIANSNSFTLQSDATGSASIGAIPSTATITGSYNVQRFLTGGNSKTGATYVYRSYRLLSNPVNTSGYINLNYLNAAATINGTTYYGAFTAGVGSDGAGKGFNVYNRNPTIYFYNEPHASSNSSFTSGKNFGVTAITSGSTSIGLTDGNNYNIPTSNGYLLYYVGSSNPAVRTTGSGAIAPDNATITNVGTINQQNITTNLWYTPNAGAVAGTAGKLSITTGASYSGINMVGNPYPSIIDLNQVVLDNSSQGYSKFYELVDANPNNGYVSYITTGNPATAQFSSPSYSSRYIASGQGFLIAATAAGQSLTFMEDQKVYNSTPVLSGTTTPPILLSLRNAVSTSGAVSTPGAVNSLKVNRVSTDALTEPANRVDGLHLKVALDSVTYNECGIYFGSAWSDNFDNNDAIDIAGTTQKIDLSSLTADGNHVGINSMSGYTKGKRVALYVKAATDGNYSFSLSDMQNMDTTMFHVYLVDNLKKDSVDIIKTKYAFTITNADTTTYGANRFVLAIDRNPVAPYQLISFTGQKTSNGVLLTWKTSNEGNYTGFTIQKQDAGGNTQYTTLYGVQSNSAGTYTYTDHNPVVGNNTYRLGQNNIDSLETYSTPVNVVYNTASASSGVLSVYPNPAKEQITVSLSNATNLSAAQSYQANVYNSTGLIVLQQSVSSSSWSQDVSALRPGGYVLEVRAGNGTLIGNTKFTKYQ